MQDDYDHMDDEDLRHLQRERLRIIQRRPRPRLLYVPGQRTPRRPAGALWILILVCTLAYDPQHPWSGLIAVGAVLVLLMLLIMIHNHRK